MRVLTLAAVTAAALAMVACDSAIKAPYTQGVCYVVMPAEDGKGEPELSVVARDQPQIEFCAARLEEMRLRFLRMGGSRREITGAYQGQFIFIDRIGVSFSRTLDGNRFIALARTGDGRLAIPAAIQREMDGTPIAVAAPPPEPAN
ncbi:hypothetical protein [uncultured Brevundimonas sp.]|uniref:hypothetical protein n=1 Tax=uncultured Brevundimonas sp. TaxID=213418 RepID=UPI0030EE41B0|tara:strand:- start:133 stop:570 length:438 start_codon:yes stop_codon:yes gene_type:complete